MNKNIIQITKDFFCFPLLFFISHDAARKLGITSLQDERFNVCMPFLSGNVLDVGCGKDNNFIKRIGYGVGIDPYFSDGTNMRVKAEDMDFGDKSFKTITMMGTLRYIKDRSGAMDQIGRVLDDDGLLLVLENHPLMNMVRHALIKWWNPYVGMEDIVGMRKKDIELLAEENNFMIIKTIRYVYGLSIMYVLMKKTVTQ